MNREDIEHMWKVASNDPNHDTNWHDPVVVAFANLVAKHTLANIDPSSFMTWQEGYEAGKQTEREAWEHRYARLQSLMDVRETQPNKPCCLAEREACAKVCEDAPEPDGADLAKRIRARGQE